MTTFATPGQVSLRIALGAGHVQIDAEDTDRTEVELVPLRDDDATREAIADATVEARERGDRTEIVVEIPRKGWNLLGRGASVGIRVHCPHGTDVDTSTASADVTARGQFGKVSAKTASGDISFDAVETLNASTASGDVEAGEIAGEGSVKSASGDTSIRRALGSLLINLASGGAVVGEALGRVSVSTVSGDQQIGSVEAGEVKLHSVSGDVEVGVRPGLRVWIDATSVSGALNSDLAAEDSGPASGEAEVVLRIRTVSGDVRIVRAALAAA
jgi:DUF4097 and DUF4098 domain-containing protein YvlB